MTICLITQKNYKYRERKCFTQDELGKILNASYVSACRWETGRFEPTIGYQKETCRPF